MADYEGLIKKSIHRLKYQNDISLAYELSKFLTILLESTDWHVDIVIPVPLSKHRLDARGYNQASLLAFPLALGLKSSYTTKGLVRVRETRSQVSLGLLERRENVRNAFLADPKVVKDKVVLLVDDVMTTGATINSAAQALHSAGVRKVLGLTVAKVFSKSIEVENAASNQV